MKHLDRSNPHKPRSPLTLEGARTRSNTRGAGSLALAGLVAFGASVTVTAACSSPFDSCEARRKCPVDPSAGGEGGEDGSPKGGSDGQGGASGGTGGNGGGNGGSAGTAGVPSSGGSGTLPSNGGAAGEESSAGAGGSTDTPTVPECEDGERACGLPGTTEQRICRDGAWTQDDPCASGKVCSGATPTCVDVATGCEDKRPGESFCDAGTSVQCSGDLTQVTEEPCAEACKEGRCVAATCGDGEVQGAEQCDDANDIGGDGCTNACQWGPKQLVIKDMGSCAIFGNGWAKCWGYNYYGQLGTGDVVDRGDNVDEMGKNLPFIEIDGVPGVFSDLAIGHHACGVSDGTLWCWGRDVPLASSPALRPVRVDVGGRVLRSVGNCALLESGQVKCWGNRFLGYPTGDVALPVGDDPSEMGANLRAVNLIDRAVALDAGGAMCALLQSGQIQCWGEDGYENMILGPNNNDQGLPYRVDLGEGVRNKGIAVGDLHACALSSAGLRCWGDSPYGALGYGSSTGITDAASIANLPLVPVTTSSDPIATVDTMPLGTCVLLHSGGVKCWGHTGKPPANLGQPALTAAIGNIGDAPNEMSRLRPIDFGTTERVLSFGTSGGYGCALFESGQIKCWGNNAYGQLGLGHTDTIGDTEEEMGAGLRPTIVY